MADSLDSGSSVLYGRAGSSPASRTKKKDRQKPVFLFGLWGCEESAFIGAPARIQRSGSRGERSHSGATELSPPGGSEGCTACGDTVPPRAPKKRDIRWTALFFSSWGVKNPPFIGAPARTQRSGSRGERSRSGATELSLPGGSEKCAACGDAVPPLCKESGGHWDGI